MIKRLFLFLVLPFFIACSGENISPESSASVPPVSGSSRSAEQANEIQRLNDWFAEKNEERLAFSPLELTFLGRKEQYDQIDQLSLEASQEQLDWYADSITEMQQNFSYENLDQESRSSWDLWIYQYERQRDLQSFASQFYIFEQMNGTHSLFPTFMINYHRVETLEDMQAYISRLEHIERALSQELEKAQMNAKRGVRPPRFAYDIVIDEISKIISGEPFDETYNESSIWADSRSKLQTLIDNEVIDPQTADELSDQVRTTLQDHFQVGYQNILTWLRQDIENADAEPRGVWALPDGTDYYNQLLSFYTTTDLTAEEIHQIGLDEVDRIWEEMESIKVETGFDGEMLEFFDFLTSDDRFFYPDNDAGREAYLDATRGHYDFIRAKLPDYFGMLPKAELEVKRVESFREIDGAPAHYFQSSPDGSNPGVYYVHMSNMRANPTTELESTAYHEGLPGHHMQIAIALELTTVPEFRRQTGYNAYVEGWALYTEKLAWEMGAYADPYSNFGRLSNEMWRAVRLVVDTGMHAMGWTKEEAVNYFAAHTLVPIESVIAEINRYLVIPGQATSYKIGMLKILELRERTQNALGEEFDIREFHDVVLSGGALPLDILDRRIDNYIQASLNGEG